jgi:glycosyltransferase involved in cell wall biosynthesis
MTQHDNSIEVSILLPFHNEEQMLEACLDSIQAQSLKAYELLAVNDASTDESTAIVSERARKDPRIHLLHSPARHLVSTLNYGLNLAKGPLVARMDADDLMHPERLLSQYRYLHAHPQCDLVASRARLFPDSEIDAGYREYIRWQNQCLTQDDITADIYIESPFAHPSVMFRKNCVQRLGGYRQGLFPEDYDLWLRMHHAGCHMAKLPEFLLDWRDHPNRTSRIDPRCSREAFDRLRAHYLSQDSRLEKRRDNFVIWGAGRKTRKRCRHLLKKGFRPTAWIDIDPRKIGNRLDNVPVVPPDWLKQNPRPFVLCYVSNHGARDLIATQLQAMGYQRGKNYLMVG